MRPELGTVLECGSTTTTHCICADTTAPALRLCVFSREGGTELQRYHLLGEQPRGWAGRQRTNLAVDVCSIIGFLYNRPQPKEALPAVSTRATLNT